MNSSEQTSPLDNLATLETTLKTVVNPSARKTAIRGTASLVSLASTDLSTLSTDQPISTISGTLVSQMPICRALLQRRSQRRTRCHYLPQYKPLVDGAVEEMFCTTSPIISLQRSTETETPLASSLSSAQSAEKKSTADVLKGYSLETQADAYGIYHYRIHAANHNHFRAFPKHETSAARVKTDARTKMPTISSQSDAHRRRSSSQRVNQWSPVELLPTIGSGFKQRPTDAACHGIYQPDSIERTNQIFEELYVSVEKK